ncbi:MAG: hypothetical protein ACI8P9_004153 [Parasphingorhabdus sp.]|jgi:hypothetical protein
MTTVNSIARSLLTLILIVGLGFGSLVCASNAVSCCEQSSIESDIGDQAGSPIACLAACTTNCSGVALRTQVVVNTQSLKEAHINQVELFLAGPLEPPKLHPPKSPRII